MSYLETYCLVTIKNVKLSSLLSIFIKIFHVNANNVISALVHIWIKHEIN